MGCRVIRRDYLPCIRQEESLDDPFDLQIDLSLLPLSSKENRREVGGLAMAGLGQKPLCSFQPLGSSSGLQRDSGVQLLLLDTNGTHGPKVWIPLDLFQLQAPCFSIPTLELGASPALAQERQFQLQNPFPASCEEREPLLLALCLGKRRRITPHGSAAKPEGKERNGAFQVTAKMGSEGGNAAPAVKSFPGARLFLPTGTGCGSLCVPEGCSTHLQGRGGKSDSGQGEACQETGMQPPALVSPPVP